MKKNIILTIFLFIPVFSFAANGDVITINSREIVEKLAVLEGKFLTVNQQFEVVNQQFEVVNQKFDAVNQKMDQKFDAVNQKMDQKFDAVNQKMDQKFDAVDQKFDAVNQKFDAVNQKMDQQFEFFNQIVKSFNLRINDLIESVNSRFAIFQWVIGGIFVVLIYIIRMIFKMPDIIIARIQAMNVDEIFPQVTEAINKKEKQMDSSLGETIETLKINVESIMEYLKNNTSFKALAPQPV